MPIISVPIAGNMNYFQNGTGDGVIIILIAVLGAFFSHSGRYKGLLISGIAALAVLAFTFISFKVRMSGVRSQMKTDLANNPFAGVFGETMLSTIQIQWGWAVLITGALLLIAAALLREDNDEKDKTFAFNNIGNVVSKNIPLAIAISIAIFGLIGIAIYTNWGTSNSPIASPTAPKAMPDTSDFTNKVGEILQVAFLSKSFEKADYRSDSYRDLITTEFRFTNKGAKDISGFKGTAEFSDMFDDKIRSLNLSYDKSVRAGQSVEWTGSLDFNQFENADVKFRDISTDKIKFNFKPNTIIFTDGSKLER